MSDDNLLGLSFAIQRYIDDYIGLSGKIDSVHPTGWENITLSKYVSSRLIKHGWIKNDVLTP
jgi:hypothetical protein